MSDIYSYIQILLNWISLQNFFLIWMFFAVSNFLENVFPPWPGDMITVFGGFLTAQGSFGFIPLVTSTIFGNLAGGIIMYVFGSRVIHFIREHHFPLKSTFYSEEGLEETFQWFNRNSVVVVLLSRFSAGVRFFVSIVAGMTGMKLPSFLFYFTIAILVWSGMLISGGYYLGKNWDKVLEVLSVYNRVVGVIILLLVIAAVWRWKSREK